MSVKTSLWTAAALVLVLSAQTAFAQLERDIIEREYVITSEAPDVYYDFGEEGWRTKARAENDREREMRDEARSKAETMDAAPQEEKLLTNVEASEREPVEGAASVVYRDVGNPEPEEANKPSDASQAAQPAPDNAVGAAAYYNYWDVDGDGDIERVPARANAGQTSSDVLERGERGIGGYIERHDNYVDDNTRESPSLRFDAEGSTDWSEPRTERGTASGSGRTTENEAADDSTSPTGPPATGYDSSDFVVEDPADLDDGARTSAGQSSATGSQ